MMNTRSVIGAVLGFSLLLTGCGPLGAPQAGPTDGSEQSAGAGNVSDATADSSGPSGTGAAGTPESPGTPASGPIVSSPVDSGGASRPADTGLGLPLGWPEEVPVPDGAVFIISRAEPDGTTWVIRYQAAGTVYELYNLYRDHVEEYEYTDIIDASGGEADSDTVIEEIGAGKDKQYLHVMLTSELTADGIVEAHIAYYTNWDF